MKKYAAALTFLSVLFQSTSAMAWIGGPYSNNTADGKSGGVFQGTITMKNGSVLFGRLSQIQMFKAESHVCGATAP